MFWENKRLHNHKKSDNITQQEGIQTLKQINKYCTALNIYTPYTIELGDEQKNSQQIK